MSLKGNKRAPKHSQRFICAKAGSPKRGDPQGDGTLILPQKENFHKGFFLREGAALEGGPECASDTGTQGR
jgi:hypothetical protein